MLPPPPPPISRSWRRPCLKGQVLRLDASKSLKMPCLRPRTAIFFDLWKMGQGHNIVFSSSEISRKISNFCANTFFFFEEHLRVVSLVLGLKGVYPRKVGPWPRIFFVSLGLGLESVSSIPGPPRGGAGGTITSGPMGFRKAVGPWAWEGLIEMTLRNQHVRPKDHSFFEITKFRPEKSLKFR